MHYWQTSENGHATQSMIGCAVGLLDFLATGAEFPSMIDAISPRYRCFSELSGVACSVSLSFNTNYS